MPHCICILFICCSANVFLCASRSSRFALGEARAFLNPPPLPPMVSGARGLAGYVECDSGSTVLFDITVVAVDGRFVFWQKPVAASKLTGGSCASFLLSADTMRAELAALSKSVAAELESIGVQVEQCWKLVMLEMKKQVQPNEPTLRADDVSDTQQGNLPVPFTKKAKVMLQNEPGGQMLFDQLCKRLQTDQGAAQAAGAHC